MLPCGLNRLLVKLALNGAADFFVSITMLSLRDKAVRKLIKVLQFKNELTSKFHRKFLLLSKTSAILLFNLSIFRLELFAESPIEERCLELMTLSS